MKYVFFKNESFSVVLVFDSLKTSNAFCQKFKAEKILKKNVSRHVDGQPFIGCALVIVSPFLCDFDDRFFIEFDGGLRYPIAMLDGCLGHVIRDKPFLGRRVF
ncbi:MAG: hypothetical protein Q9M28_04770 [Mariprofundaceae bacterium]|nr:hypothetical protein [Mariprofundaceae bacterium]